MPRVILALLALVFLVLPAFAEEPPARVGRVAYVEGELGFHTAGETAWSAAAVNYPVATGTSFWTDPQTRAEIRIGAQSIALASNTEIDVTQLDEQVMRIAVPQGRIELRLRHLREGESVEIDIPRGGVWLLQPGIYDIDAGAADGPARIAVFEGRARFAGGTLDLGIKAGDAAVISGTDTLTAKTERAAADAFAEWCRSRDYHEHRLAAPYYVSPRMTGYEALDEYGAWRSLADYGEVWMPKSVPAGWAPYRDGHWAWIDPWGWTWVDAEPWGFAPFHYGRWVQIEDRWAWAPGRFAEQPVYAPALVAFVGEGALGVPIGRRIRPAVGWFPLGPNEAYLPSYTRDPNYLQRVNAPSVDPARLSALAEAALRSGPNNPRAAAAAPARIAPQAFANRAAATIVPTPVFANAGRVSAAAIRLPPQALQQMPVSLRPPPITPMAERLAARRGPAAQPGMAVLPPAATGSPGPGASAAAISAAEPPGHGGPSGHFGPPSHTGLPGPTFAAPASPSAEARQLPGRGHRFGPASNPPGGSPGFAALPPSSASFAPPAMARMPRHAPAPGFVQAPPRQAAPPAIAYGRLPHRGVAPPPAFVHTAPPRPVPAPPPAMAHAPPPPHPMPAPPPAMVHMAAPHPAPAPPPVAHAPPPAPHPAPPMPAVGSSAPPPGKGGPPPGAGGHGEKKEHH